MQTLESQSDINNASINPGSKWPMAGLIEFDNVQLRYGDDEQLTIDHVSFTINNAEKIGVVIN